MPMRRRSPTLEQRPSSGALEKSNTGGRDKRSADGKHPNDLISYLGTYHTWRTISLPSIIIMGLHVHESN